MKNQCKKQTVIAILMKDQQVISMGDNRIGNPNIVKCPREGMKSGEGYDICHNVCRQKWHAEVEACLKAGDNAKGATMYLIGHTYCCNNCIDVMQKYGVAEVIFAEKAWLSKLLLNIIE